MAINLKEIFNTDDDNIRVDKINYNFDQLLANGGGPVGIQGASGQTGLSGPQGAMGATGAVGATGLSGNDGISQNIWLQNSQTDAENVDFYVVRPFNIEVDSTLDLKTRVILGDENSSLSNGGIPTYTPQALLSIITPQDASNNTETQSHIELKDSTTNSPSFFIRNNYIQGNGGTLQIIGNSASSGETTKMQLAAPNSIILDSETLLFNGSNNVSITSYTANIEINAEINVSVLAEGDVLIKNTGGGNIEIGDTSGNTDEIIVEGVNFKTNSSITSELSSPTNKLTASLVNEITSLGENNFTSDLNTNIISNSTTAGQGINLEASSTYCSIFNKIDGDTKLQISYDKTYSKNNIEFGLDLSLYNQNGVYSGTGIEFTEGPDTDAPNYAKGIGNRTFSDYFWQGNLQLWGPSNATSSIASPVKCIDFTTSSSPGALWYDINSSSAAGYTIRNLTPLNDISSTTWGNFTYVKTGDKIDAWGNFHIGGSAQAYSALAQDQRHCVAIVLNNTGEFPYTNDSGGPIHVDVKFAKSWTYFGGNGNVAGEFYSPIHDGVETDGGRRDIISIKGVINEGDNRILLLWEGMNPNFLSDVNNNQANDIITSGMAPSYFYTGSELTRPYVSIKFSMFTTYQSYRGTAGSGGGGTGSGSGSGAGSGSTLLSSGSGSTGSSSGSGSTGSSSGSGATGSTSTGSGSGSGNTLGSGSGSGT